MKKTIPKIAFTSFALTLIVILIIRTPYYKAFRDHIFPSRYQNVTMQADASESELGISYRWTGFKEFYTYADYIIIRYNHKNIEFNYNGVDGSKDFYKLDRYLQGNIPTILTESSEKELVIPIDSNSRKGKIIIPLKNQDARTEGISVYFAHIVMLPMDIPTGWISQKVDIAD